MENNAIIKVSNRSVGSLGYTLPEMRIRRHFTPKETKEISFEELKTLYQSDGGRDIVKENLAVHDKEALKELGLEVEPEYFYTENEVKNIMLTGSLNEFLDMLDFAPDGVLEIIKSLAIALPLNDIEKRDAILEKMNFNVTKAIEIQNTAFDGGNEDIASANSGKKVRRVSNNTENTPSNLKVRRV